MTPEQSKALRVEFPAGSIGKIPRKNKQTGQVVWLDYVGHAEVTDRLLAVDPEWNWEPVAWDGGSPVMERTQDGAPIGLWGRLTICGVTRVAYGSVERGTFEPEKQLISDLIRNGAMRFGVALDLWAKSDLHHDDGDSAGGGASGATLAKGARPGEEAARPANIDGDGVVHGEEAVDSFSWPNFFRAAKALNGIENMAQLKEKTGDSDAHRWDVTKRAAYLETLGQPVKNPPGIVPRGTPHWSESEPWGPRAFELMADMKLTEAMFSRPFGCEVTQHNFVRLVGEWLAANPTRGIEILCAMAMAPVEVAR